MANGAGAKELALKLAEAAREIRETWGDFRAQTVTYGLLLRRWGAGAGSDNLLHDFSDSRAVSRVERVLDSADLRTVADCYAQEGKDADVYFYEQFLRAYSPREAKTRGVRYTPPEVVSYIVRAASSILEEHFGESLGEAVVVDPCCGVGTFPRYIQKHTRHAPRVIGVELMRAPCAIASSLAGEGEARCVDFLEETDLDIGRNTLVILGNPPYSGHSSNAGKISDLVADYRAGLNERNPKWLQDDYVKFIRMAQDRVESAGRGIIAFITNHSYAFNPTFRVMRSSLMRSFNEIYVLDLHGNAKRVEKAGDGGPDENVFPIQMGVAISLFVKRSNAAHCAVKYGEIRGSRQSKLAKLAAMDLHNTPWREAAWHAPFFLFTPSDGLRTDEYARFVPVTEIFESSCVGFVTSRDRFAVDFEKDTLLERISTLRNPSVAAERIRSEYPVGDLDIEKARRILLEDPEWEAKAVEVLYRPFDRRWAYCSRAVMERPRLPFMENLLRENIALAIGRAGQATGSELWDVAFCTDRPADLNLFRRGGAMLFPRYIWEDGLRRSNVKIESCDADLLFNFMYAILYSIVYRRRYAELLKIDYPRIPIPRDAAAIRKLAQLGSELMSVHLMRDGPRSPLEEDEDVSMRIGGYEIPGKYIAYRRCRGLPMLAAQTYARVRGAAAETAAIQARIDEAIRTDSPW